jgi:transcription elongation GreA/GreB family factor
MPPNKKALFKQLIQHLAERLAGFDRSARAAHEEATHEQNKAENKYDTRALEASYLAAGQSRQAAELLQAIESLEAFQPEDLPPNSPATIGALVELTSGRERAWYLLAPCAGGTELLFENTPVLVLAPRSPLGVQLLGRKAGEKLTVIFGREKVEHQLLSVF